MIRRMLSVALVLIFGISCVTTGRLTLTQDVRDAIALCTGGYSATAERQLRAELAGREGALISEAEVAERGATSFQFGELQGGEAIEMYNNYVTCVIESSRRLPAGEVEVQPVVPEQQQGGGPERPGVSFGSGSFPALLRSVTGMGMTLDLPLIDNEVSIVSCPVTIHNDGSEAAYLCSFRNEAVTPKQCMLLTACVSVESDGDTATFFGNNVIRFLMRGNSMGMPSGSVSCHSDYSNLALAHSLACQ